MSIRILLVDDHRILREALRAMLEREADFRIVGEAGDGLAALRLVRELHPDIVLLDVTMKDLDGIATCARITARGDEARVIALSAFGESRFVLEMLKAGARGYVTKESAGAELVNAIRAVMAGQNFLSADVAHVVVGLLRDGVPRGAAAVPLGRREREVLQLIAAGKRSGEIAEVLHIAVSTVDAHRRNIMRKLGLHSIAELTRYAIRHGLATA